MLCHKAVEAVVYATTAWIPGPGYGDTFKRAEFTARQFLYYLLYHHHVRQSSLSATTEQNTCQRRSMPQKAELIGA